MEGREPLQCTQVAASDGERSILDSYPAARRKEKQVSSRRRGRWLGSGEEVADVNTTNYQPRTEKARNSN